MSDYERATIVNERMRLLLDFCVRFVLPLLLYLVGALEQLARLLAG